MRKLGGVVRYFVIHYAVGRAKGGRVADCEGRTSLSYFDSIQVVELSAHDVPTYANPVDREPLPSAGIAQQSTSMCASLTKRKVGDGGGVGVIGGIGGDGVGGGRGRGRG